MHKKLRYRRPEGGVTMLDFVKFRTRLARSVFELQCRAPPRSTRNFKLYNKYKERTTYSANRLRKMEKTAKICTFSRWSGGRGPHLAPNCPRFFLTSQPARGMVPRRKYSSCEKIRRQNIFWGSPNFGGHSHPQKFLFRQSFYSAVFYSPTCDLSSNFNSIAQKLAEIRIFEVFLISFIFCVKKTDP